MPEIERLGSHTSWIELDFVERKGTPREIIEVGIPLHIAGLSRSNTKQILDRLGVERSRTAIHNWVQKPTYSPVATPSRITSRSTRQ